MQTSQFIAIAAATAAALFLTACDRTPEHREAVNNAAITDSTPDEAPPPATNNSFSPEDAANGVGAASPAETAIPAAFHGRWGMVPGDCGPDASIAKGLMVVDGAKLRFYESVGKPAVVTNPTPSSMQGRFSFSGEGMEWSKDMVLTLKGDGSILVRTESDPKASYSYNRCPA